VCYELKTTLIARPRGRIVFGDGVQLASNNVFLLIAAVASGMLLLGLAFLRVLRRPVELTLRQKVAATARTRRVTDERMLQWLPPDVAGERRGGIRRAGRPTPVRVATSSDDDPDDPEATIEGLVINRSTGGLCLAVEQPFRVEDKIFLWVEDAENFPWVPVVVRHCRDCGGYFLVGCEFRHSLPLTVLLQFG
jgi:hypothetical protein